MIVQREKDFFSEEIVCWAFQPNLRLEKYVLNVIYLQWLLSRNLNWDSYTATLEANHLHFE
jgi:hypothetical protein